MITVYTKHLCGYCDMAKNYLRENNLEFTEINIDEDQNARNICGHKGTELHHKFITMINY